jgi:hypothetical protein
MLAEIAGGLSLARGLFGSGGRASVPGSMARPTDPTSKFVDDSGMLREQFRTAGLTNKELETGRGLLGNLAQRAQAQGPSQQAEYLMKQQELGSQAQRDALQKNMASQAATQQANLAMKGGLGTGARERMAQSQGLAGMQNLQNIARQGEQGKMGILAQDEAQKLGLLSSLPGQFRGYGQDLMQRQVGDVQGGMGLKMDKYGRDMQAFAANQIARQQAQQFNASNKGILGGLFG